MKAYKFYFLGIAAVIAFSLITVGCSGEADLLKDISGKWKANQNDGTVEIHLVGAAKSITMGGHTYPVTVEKIEMINYMVNMKAQNGNAEPESWSIQQVWNTNGDGYKLAFKHNGKKDVLVSRAQS